MTENPLPRESEAALEGTRVGGTMASAGKGGPKVFLHYDQAALDAAYNQDAYAPNRQQVLDRYAANSERARVRLGAPSRFAYGPTEIEKLDIHRAGAAAAPVNIFIHGGVWRGGLARNYAFLAELFTCAGAHFVVPDFVWVQDAGGSLMVMADQIRRAIAWIHRNAARFSGDPARIYLSGHSSGAHLAGAALITDWPREFDLPADVIKARCSSAACMI